MRIAGWLAGTDAGLTPPLDPRELAGRVEREVAAVLDEAARSAAGIREQATAVAREDVVRALRENLV